MRYGMAIDLKRCFGCQTCAVACKVANNLPKNLWYNRVTTKGGAVRDLPGGEYPNSEISYFPLACQHCSSPVCVEVCPTGASKISQDGIVLIEHEACIGCGSCIEACPYQACTLLKDDPQYYVDVKLGEFDAPPHLVATAEKCTFCKNLIDRGEVPACMQLCPGRARFWGDLDDPESEPNRAKEGREVMLYLEDQNTGPNVFYLQ